MQKKEKNMREMFDIIALRYDLVNFLITLGRDQAWRRFAVRRSGIKTGGVALDLCCGTGRLTRELARSAAPDGRVVGLDFSERMLKTARKKNVRFPQKENISLVLGNAMNIPFADSSFDCVVISWGLRNLPDLAAAVREMVRIVKPGGRVVCLDTGRPGFPPVNICFSIYLKHLVPFLGRLCTGNRDVYSYLHHSVQIFPPPHELSDLFSRAGLVDTSYKCFGFGAVAVVEGRKPERG